MNLIERTRDAVVEHYRVMQPYYAYWGYSAIHFGIEDVGRLRPRDPGDRQRHHDALDRMSDRLLQMCRIRDGQVLLDAGCGYGRVTRLAAQTYPHSPVIGVNVSLPQLQAASKLRIDPEWENHRFTRQLTPAENAVFLQADFHQLPIRDASVDVVWFLESSQHAAMKPLVFGEAFRVLKLGGRLTVFDFFPTTRRLSAPDHRRLKTMEDHITHAPMVAIDDAVDMLGRAGFTQISVTSLAEETRASWGLAGGGSRWRLRIERLVRPDDPLLTIAKAYQDGYDLASNRLLGYFAIAALK